jgi:hypothetical protein
MSTNETGLEMPTKVSDLGKAVAVIERGGGSSMVVPDNMHQQIEFAKVMSTGGAMIGKPFRNNPGACLGICNQAWQWGMNPFSVSQKAYLVNEIIAFEAQLVHAVVLKLAPLSKRPRFTYDGENDQRRCTVTFWVKGEDEPLTYTSPPFGKITPKNSPLWKTDPDQQQSYYTIRAGARRYFPEVLMGVLDYEEAVEITRIEGEKTKVITLSGSTDNIPEAEFSDGTIVLEKNAKAKKKPVKEKGAPPVSAVETGGTETEGGSSSVEPNNTAPAEAANEPVNEEQAETDFDIVARVSAEIRAAPAGSKSQPIREARGALTRIAQTSEDKKLAAKAEQILNLYDLD